MGDKNYVFDDLFCWLCIATIVTIVGFGGGILWMPFLLLVLNMRPDTAILTSLFIQTAGTASGSMAYIRQGKTDNRLAILLLAIAAPGVAVGALIGHRLSLSHIELVIGLISLATVLLFVSVNQRYDEEGSDRANCVAPCATRG
ncbi:MAG: sulfite exporter TauE/SafE family protein [Dissulfurimicrobium sp.]|uniref:sulfite exporter TauE/SafE family protein n=1 Tax=Dissulfurimicrobium sp. TaxID=2022436 RepID=UPI00404A2F4F